MATRFIPPPEDAARIRAAVDRHGITRVASAAAVMNNTLIRAAAGQPIQRATLKVVLSAIDELDRTAQAVTP